MASTDIKAAGDFVFSSAPFRECHASTVVEAGEGRILVAFFAGTEEGSSDVAIWLSEGGSGPWSPPRMIARDEGAPCWNPVLFKGAGGKIYLFYKIGPSPETWSGVYVTSDDGGARWSDPHYLPAGLLGPAKNKPIIASNGDVVCGTSVESYRAWTCWVEILSRQRWERFGPICYEGVNKGVIQPSIVETSDGRLRAFMRSTERIGRICVADSSDYGRTWGRAIATGLPNPNSGIDCVRLRSGTIVMAYNDSSTSRSPLSVAASDDFGVAWKKVLDIEAAEGELSYPSIIEGLDGRIHITYTWMRKRIKHVALECGEIERALGE